MGSLGSYLKRERELRQMSIAELAQITRIPARVLQHLENDAHSELPADVFVRGFLRSYAHALGLDDESVLARYRGRESQEPPPSLPAVYAPEPGRRFGIAIALFILPPSLPILLERLRGRSSESEEVVQRRFRVAQEEIAHYGLFDYVIVNDDLEEAATRLISIFRAEECRRNRQALLAERLLSEGRGFGGSIPPAPGA